MPENSITPWRGKREKNNNKVVSSSSWLFCFFSRGTYLAQLLALGQLFEGIPLVTLGAGVQSRRCHSRCQTQCHRARRSCGVVPLFTGGCSGAVTFPTRLLMETWERTECWHPALASASTEIAVSSREQAKNNKLQNIQAFADRVLPERAGLMSLGSFPFTYEPLYR